MIKSVSFHTPGKDEKDGKSALRRKRSDLVRHLSRKSTGHIKHRGFSTFKSMREGFQDNVTVLYKQFNEDVPLELVEKVVAYCRCVCPEEIDSIIEQNMFDAIMSKRFNLTKRIMLDQMFKVASKRTRPPFLLKMDNLAELILLFLCPDIQQKAEFVFHVYDINNRGSLTKPDLRSVLAPMLVDIKTDDLDDDEDLVGNFVDLVATRMDVNHDSVIELNEFQEMVEKDSMWLQFLGPCLPSDADTKSFRELFEGLTLFEVQAKFRSESRYLLQTPEPKLSGTFNGLYPFRLELP